MKNIFLILKQIFILLFLVGPLVSQGVIHKNEKFSLNQTIVFEIFEAIKNGDSKNYEGLFYELAASLESPREFRRLLSMTDEAGNNIFHLMASVPPESPAFRFFLKEMGSLLVFLTLPKKYYDSLSLNPPSFGGMSYEEMPEVIKFNQAGMPIESVVKEFLQKKNNKAETPFMIARDNKILPDLNALELFNNFKQLPAARPSSLVDNENQTGINLEVIIFATFVGFMIPAGFSAELGVAFVGGAIGFSAGLLKALKDRNGSQLRQQETQARIQKDQQRLKNDCHEAIARWKADIDHNI